ncbi:MAG: hypothetical protein KDD53_13280, partial [Bdellovibrionales bacterium]|nr:hypothetical protein [Bdellovibrionales bacterium]
MSSTERIFYWTEAFLTLSPESKSILLSEESASDPLSIFQFGSAVDELHRELCGASLDFSAAFKLLDALPQFYDHERWEVLIELSRSYFSLVEDSQKCDPFKLELDWKSLEYRDVSFDIYLAGIVEISKSVREILLGSPHSITSFIFAPNEYLSSFDRFGGLNVDASG